MGLNYQTEYRLGRRGGRVCRRYTGLRAFLAIAIDLLFLLTFELVFGVIFFVLRNVLTLFKGVLYALSLPFRAAQWVSLKLDQRAAAVRSRRGAGAILKPAWASSDEL
jgi:hypothetical protein